MANKSKESIGELLDLIYEDQKNLDKKKEAVGIYLKRRTSDALDIYAREKGHGAKTHLINELVDIFLERYGYFDKLDKQRLMKAQEIQTRENKDEQ